LRPGEVAENKRTPAHLNANHLVQSTESPHATSC
jgi:hypothetical protein